ncbi:MAG: hypothetical protein CSA65_01265 [Proteobacteria bacterium]|nr:MAG: hypothetical protein CSB49_00205 [Pseudomonadota bacterium]PIE19718.1 MAG: hypothetical protein CSA65_01265 [Pseudomonadota bacterium]
MREAKTEPAAEPPKDERFRQRLEGLVPDLVKRTFYAGLGALFTSEEGVRRLANEFSLPKDVATYLISQAQGTKDELFRIVAAELRGFLESLNLTDELQRLLTTLSFEIKTEVRFIPNDQKLKPSIKQSVAVRRRKKGPRRGKATSEAKALASEEAADSPTQAKKATKASKAIG